MKHAAITLAAALTACSATHTTMDAGVLPECGSPLEGRRVVWCVVDMPDAGSVLACIDTFMDEENCGGCGDVCAVFEACDLGECR